MTARDDPRWSDLPAYANLRGVPWYWTTTARVQLAALFDDHDQLTAQVAAVRALHVEDDHEPDAVGFCQECALAWPCHTARALRVES